jgi:hypothetical protein
MLNNKRVIVLTIVLLILVVYLITIHRGLAEVETKEPKASGREDSPYVTQCLSLFRKINTPNASLFFNPPLDEPPAHMLSEFTQNGEMPIRKKFYINEIYTDSTNADKSIQKVITRADLDVFREKMRKKQPLHYDDSVLSEMMRHFSPALREKSMAVIGTLVPWVEAISLEVGCSKIVSLDYTHNSYEMTELEWFHVRDYLNRAIEHRLVENFDNAVSFSSLEHAGLGRYGDELNPNGDLEAVKQIHCMLKPGGLFFLALPTSSDGSSYIEFNAHRVYGKARLDLLFKGWRYLSSRSDSMGSHVIFVLQKI